MASASLPHQGRFAPLRGAREERASLTRQPVRHPLELQGRDEEQGFFGPNKEQGLEDGRDHELSTREEAAQVENRPILVVMERPPLFFHSLEDRRRRTSDIPRSRHLSYIDERSGRQVPCPA